ncbi:DUF5596 domain-containing protein [Kribbella sandramycini]|uniref:DUF5596 domain-containing protein n=1 Tax=Kribbella sandramycini TaxID=60450 RepID=A0A7Y4KVJ7_9ACTN|nr:acyltransferase domain-containing protein [Kribbella sandramycini]MBB6567988.1 hypothetical protein [Kribbella sandramycini]NOL39418.1 DUF5596 domain-containing protein [Kribbella sandramycini]
MDLLEAAERLEFPTQAWKEFPQTDGIQLPDNPTDLLTYCGVAEADQQAMLAARPDPDEHPEWWAVLSAIAGSLDRDWERPLPPTGFKSWPVVPENSPAVGMFAWAWALLSVVPRLLDTHAQRGVPEKVTKATIVALGGILISHREVYGRPGVGLMPLWGPPLRFRCADYEIGRLNFTRTELGLGYGVSGRLLSIHIPPTGPLDAAAAAESIDAAAALFPQWYPDEPIYAFTCHSWLLDPQLADHLPAESNIVRFQQRFRLLPHLPPSTAFEGDHELMRLALQLDPPDGALSAADLAAIPEATSLQRAFVRHLSAGRHFHLRTGLLTDYGRDSHRHLE